MTVPVRRATWPSTASSTSADDGDRDQHRGPAPAAQSESTVSAVTAPTRVARVSVTRSAGPSVRPSPVQATGERGRQDQPVRDTGQPPGDGRDRRCARATSSSASWTIRPIAGPSRTDRHRASVIMA